MKINLNIKILSIVGIISILVIGSVFWLNAREGGEDASTTQDKVTKDEVNSASTTPKKFSTLRYLYSTSSASAYEFAEELGYLEEEGIKLEKVGVSDGTAIQGIQSVSNGDVDVAQSAWLTIVNAMASGVKIRPVVALSGIDNITRGYSFTVLNNSGIYGAKDFKDKKIAIAAFGSRWEYLAKIYLRKNGLSIKDVQLVVVPNAQQEQVLISKQVDVISVGEPIKGKILDGGEARELEDSSEYKVYDEIGFSAAPTHLREDFIKENPEIVNRFVRASVKAVEWARENPEEANELYAKIVQKNGGNTTLAKYWTGFGAPRYGIIKDSDVQSWIDILETEGKYEKGKLQPSDFYTNEINPYYGK